MNKNSDFDVVKEIFSWISIIVVAAVIALVPLYYSKLKSSFSIYGEHNNDR